MIDWGKPIQVSRPQSWPFLDELKRIVRSCRRKDTWNAISPLWLYRLKWLLSLLLLRLPDQICCNFMEIMSPLAIERLNLKEPLFKLTVPGNSFSMALKLWFMEAGTVQFSIPAFWNLVSMLLLTYLECTPGWFSNFVKCFAFHKEWLSAYSGIWTLIMFWLTSSAMMVITIIIKKKS